MKMKPDTPQLFAYMKERERERESKGKRERLKRARQRGRERERERKYESEREKNCMKERTNTNFPMGLRRLTIRLIWASSVFLSSPVGVHQSILKHSALPLHE